MLLSRKLRVIAYLGSGFTYDMCSVQVIPCNTRTGVLAAQIALEYLVV